MIIQIDNKLSEHIHAARVCDGHGFFGKANRVVAVLLASFGTWAIYTAGLQWWTIVWFILVPIEWFDLLSIRPLQILVQFIRTPKYREIYNLEFSDQGIHFTTSTIDSHIAWAHYNQVIESKIVFILIYGKMMYTVIPKRAFASENETQAFRDLVRHHIS